MLDFERQFEGLAANTPKVSLKVKSKQPTPAKKPKAAPKKNILKAAARKLKARVKDTTRIVAHSSSPSFPIIAHPKKAKPKPSRVVAYSSSPPMPNVVRPKNKTPSRAISTHPKSKAAPLAPGFSFQSSKSTISNIKPVLREKAASAIALRAVSNLAKKAPRIPKTRTAVTARKAIQAITPIAHSCQCTAAPVLRKVDAAMACKGYPLGTAEQLFAGFHDMNTAIEKAAIQRLATHEHNQLSKQQAFEHMVLARLTKIARCLPNCHPTRLRANLAVLQKA